MLLFHMPTASSLHYHDNSDSRVASDAGFPVPIRRLAGFKRVQLGAGESTGVTFEVGPDELALVDGNGDAQVRVVRRQSRYTCGNDRG